MDMHTYGLYILWISVGNHMEKVGGYDREEGQTGIYISIYVNWHILYIYEFIYT